MDSVRIVPAEDGGFAVLAAKNPYDATLLFAGALTDVLVYLGERYRPAAPAPTDWVIRDKEPIGGLDYIREEPSLGYAWVNRLGATRFPSIEAATDFIVANCLAVYGKRLVVEPA